LVFGRKLPERKIKKKDKSKKIPNKEPIKEKLFKFNQSLVFNKKFLLKKKE